MCGELGVCVMCGIMCECVYVQCVVYWCVKGVCVCVCGAYTCVCTCGMCVSGACTCMYECVWGGVCVYVCEREVCVPVGSTVCTVSGVCVCWRVFVYLRALPIYIHKVM